MAENKNTFVNVDFSKFPELLDDLNEMIAEDGDTDRSKFIRKLIRQESARRHAQQLPLPLPEQESARRNNRSKSVAA